MKKYLGLMTFMISSVSAATSLEAGAASNKQHILADPEKVVNTAEGSEGGCSASVYPPGLDIAQNVYPNLNDQKPFGVSTHTTFLANLYTFEFLTLSGFSFPEPNARRRIVFSQAPSNRRSMDSGYYSVSECPGDFTAAAICKGAIYNNSTILFSTINDDDPSRFCKLDPSLVYYINFIMTDEPYTSSPSCANPNHNQCALFYSETALE